MHYPIAAIIIDQWQDHNPDLDDPAYVLKDHIISYINQNYNVGAIMLASYDIASECESTVDYYENSRLLLGNQYSKKVSQLKNHPRRFQKTDSRLLSWNIPRTKISMHYEWELDLFLKQNTVEQFLMVGADLDECVKVRPLGYENLYRFLKNRKIEPYIILKSNLVINHNDSNFNIEQHPDWIQLNSDFYKYDPEYTIPRF